MGLIYSLIAFIGVFCFLRFLRYMYKFLYAMYAKPKNIKEKFDTDWVMITGASAGVGKELAIMCAKQGLNIIGIGRSFEKLEKVKKECTNLGVQFRQFAIDLSDISAPERIFKNCGDIKIGCLFVCHGNNNMGRIIEKTDSEVRDELNAVTTSNMLLTRYFGKQIEKKGTVTFISSLNAHTITPYASLYGPTKRFLTHFSAHMQIEGYFHNITYQTLCVGYIKNTDFNAKMPPQIRNMAKNGLPPEHVARAVLATAGKNFEADLGYDCVVEHFLVWLLPTVLVDLIFKKVTKGMIKILDESKKKTD